MNHNHLGPVAIVAIVYYSHFCNHNRFFPGHHWTDWTERRDFGQVQADDVSLPLPCLCQCDLHRTIMGHNHNADLMADHKARFVTVPAGLTSNIDV